MQRCNAAAKDKDGASDKEDVLEYTSQSQDKAAAGADEEDSGNVQQERHRRITEEDPGAVEKRTINNRQWCDRARQMVMTRDLPDTRDFIERF